MAKSVKGTQTEKNLLTSFAGESQARMRYTYFASVAKKEGYEQIAAIFTETADQWKSHATLTPLAKQNLPTFGYNMIDPLKSWCWGSILFYPFKISRFS